jgi:hypothetical protein
MIPSHEISSFCSNLSTLWVAVLTSYQCYLHFTYMYITIWAPNSKHTLPKSDSSLILDPLLTKKKFSQNPSDIFLWRRLLFDIFTCESLLSFNRARDFYCEEEKGMILILLFLVLKKLNIDFRDCRMKKIERIFFRKDNSKVKN